jgi:hypothetical protein
MALKLLARQAGTRSANEKIEKGACTNVDHQKLSGSAVEHQNTFIPSNRVRER